MADTDQTIFPTVSLESELTELFGPNAKVEVPLLPGVMPKVYTPTAATPPSPPKTPQTSGLSFPVTPQSTPTSNGPAPHILAKNMAIHEQALKFYNDMIVMHPKLATIPHSKWPYTPSRVKTILTETTLPLSFAEWKAALMQNALQADAILAGEAKVHMNQVEKQAQAAIVEEEVNAVELANQMNAQVDYAMTQGQQQMQMQQTPAQVAVSQYDDDEEFAKALYNIELAAAHTAHAIGSKNNTPLPNLVAGIAGSQTMITNMWTTNLKRHPDHWMVNSLRGNPIFYGVAAHCEAINGLVQDLFLTNTQQPLKSIG